MTFDGRRRDEPILRFSFPSAMVVIATIAPFLSLYWMRSHDHAFWIILGSNSLILTVYLGTRRLAQGITTGLFDCLWIATVVCCYQILLFIFSIVIGFLVLFPVVLVLRVLSYFLPRAPIASAPADAEGGSLRFLGFLALGSYSFCALIGTQLLESVFLYPSANQAVERPGEPKEAVLDEVGSADATEDA